MELLTSFLAGIFAFVGGILGNVMANDLCASAPRTCAFIIRRAAKRLGNHKGRYEEEWLADLSDRETVYEKYNHAIGCFLSAGRIRRQARKVTLYVVYTVPHFGPVEVTFNLSSRIITPLWFATIGSSYSFVRKCGWAVGAVYFLVRFVVGVRKKHPERMPQFAKFATEAINNKSIANWPFEVRVTKYGKSHNFTSIGKAVSQQPSLLSFAYERMREKKVIER
ncbi:MAG TPA: hypothetical protein VMT08_18185 [Bradyrhizobium sp.]|nr:hypothetical protein [Bradyrhizobium sp.]